MKTGGLRVNLVRLAIWRFRLLSSAFVYSRLFSSCASAMTLAMTLGAKDFPNLLGGILRSALEKYPQE